ncbi:glycerate kinase [Trinickia caryophylli]|uniref:Glycerate kinase n=1 Tax=Trinickia caryophylli TaxID=28094 RepID=A0A1X7DP65_TRICW|nr:glycerate kinase [Trinickia caryophylli]PMS10609.1 glycerate kinase [Trinickia caryophylli]TRX17215.1 glycerate kinase [Trinickia caryophylli]WQE12051.1 glycerate kinase [Trinickia caryophylli]SMF18915.1 glycerate kinase [Trinickia caryophylli]GLU31827.1 kinase [Trinickia caryophylli]
MPSPLPAPIVVIAPDSFKGSLSAQAVAEAIAAGVRRARADAVVRLAPMADGGEGTLDAMLARGGERRVLRVRGASGVERDAAVGILPDGSAVVETAEIVGITDAVAMREPVTARGTRGMGEAVRALLDAGVTRFFVALGGSSTNDGGAGLLVGLGLRLFDEADHALEPTPAGLARLARVDASMLDARLASATFVAMSDVDNPLTGEHGATAVFGPQKGVQPAHIAEIDATLARFAALAEAALGRAVRDLPGSGAAGGLGFALRLLGARFEPGAEVVASQVGLDAALDGASWLITGEGRSDAQTLRGKAPYVACRHARAAGVPASLLSGGVDPAALPALSAHFTGCFSPAPGPITLDVAIRDAARLLSNEAEQLTRLRYGAGEA